MTQVVIVVGGRNDTHFIDSVEIYNLDKKIWELGPPLPEPIGRASVVEFGRDVLVIGGQNWVGAGEPRKIYRFGLKSGWAKMNLQLLPQKTFGAISILVKRDFCMKTK